MDFVHAIDWQQPWYQPWADSGLAVSCAMNTQGSVHAALNQLAHDRQVPCPRFAPQSVLSPHRAYESHVADTWECPTRDGLHDFFNGLCWLQFPQSKRRLNQLQSAQIARDGVQGRRGPLRDAITLLDESAGLLSAPDPLWQALVAKDWQRLFVTLRPLWAESFLLLFGHATLERLVAPRKSMVSHVYRARFAIHFDMTTLSELDTALANDLDTDYLASKPFAPLPIMGVPGWHAANKDSNFYIDPSVFRR